ncbi:hypothetical protein FOCC_FOCC002120 [Frankliniella occidentalis]|nr:hypothetical protein FOCC_FOCC002120 [Frankliniella occidentalis]
MWLRPSTSPPPTLPPSAPTPLPTLPTPLTLLTLESAPTAPTLTPTQVLAMALHTYLNSLTWTSRLTIQHSRLQNDIAGYLHTTFRPL